MQQYILGLEDPKHPHLPENRTIYDNMTIHQ